MSPTTGGSTPSTSTTCVSSLSALPPPPSSPVSLTRTPLPSDSVPDLQKNVKQSYLDAIWNVINWETAAERFSKA